MRSIRAFGFGLGVLVLAGPLPASEQAKPLTSLSADPGVAQAIQVFDAWVARTVADREQPGVSIGIVHDQDLIWSKGYGFADLAKKTPATPATAYRIASISKTRSRSGCRSSRRRTSTRAARSSRSAIS